MLKSSASKLKTSSRVMFYSYDELRSSALNPFFPDLFCLKFDLYLTSTFCPFLLGKIINSHQHMLVYKKHKYFQDLRCLTEFNNKLKETREQRDLEEQLKTIG